MTVTTINRIAVPEKQVFFDKYVKTGRPVILTNLFANQPLSFINSTKAACEAFGSSILEIQTEYSSADTEPGLDNKKQLTLQEYINYINNNPQTRIMCTEYPTPTRVSSQYRLPNLCLMNRQE